MLDNQWATVQCLCSKTQWAAYVGSIIRHHRCKLDWLYDSLLFTCSWCVVSALAPLSCGSQVDAAHWWRLRRDPPPSTILKRFGCTTIPGLARYQFCRTGTDPIPKILSICRYRSDTWAVFAISVEFFYLSVCWPAHHSFVFYTQTTKYRQLYCKEKQ